MGKVVMGILLPGASEVGEGINKSQVGIVRTLTKQQKAYVKFIPVREIAVELLCAVLGRALGLPIPEPLLVYDPGRKAYGFGSVAAPHPNLNHWVKIGDQSVSARLAQWAHLVPAACFDEWIANDDRNKGNILFDGDKGFFLIDHGMAIRDAMPADGSILNQLLTFAISKHADDVARKRLQRNANETVASYKPPLLTSITALLPALDPLPSLVNFLNQRLHYLGMLIANRLRPQHQTDLFSHEQPSQRSS